MASVWSVSTGKKLREFAGHTAGVRTAAFSPIGHLLCTGDADGSAILWEAVSGKQLHLLRAGSEAVQSLVFNAAGTQVAIACGRSVRLVDTDTGRTTSTLTAKELSISQIALSPKGDMLLGVVPPLSALPTVWDVAKGKAEEPPCATLDRVVWGNPVQFASDDTRIFASGTTWDLSKADMVPWERALPASPLSKLPEVQVWSPDGRLALCLTLRATEVVETATANVIRKVSTDTARPAAVSPDSQKIAWKFETGGIEVWHAGGRTT